MIWEILGIGPTTDIKAIKQAYAARSKEIHPEEKPEEFRMLHEAYQAALRQAKNAGRGSAAGSSSAENGNKETGQGEIGQRGAAAEELLSCFEEMNRIRKERFAAAEILADMWEKCSNPEDMEKLQNYFRSEEFRKIQWYPQIVRLLVKELPKLAYHRFDTVWQILWEVYGFQDKEEAGYEGDVKTLRDILYSGRIRWKQEQEIKKLCERNRQAEMKRQKIFRRALAVFILVLPFLIYVSQRLSVILPQP